MNNDLNRKLQNANAAEENSTFEIHQLQEKCEKHINMLEEKYQNLCTTYAETQSEIKYRVNEEIKDRNEEIGRMMEHGHLLIGEKAQLIH